MKCAVFKTKSSIIAALSYLLYDHGLSVSLAIQEMDRLMDTVKPSRLMLRFVNVLDETNSNRTIGGLCLENSMVVWKDALRIRRSLCATQVNAKATNVLPWN